MHGPSPSSAQSAPHPDASRQFWAVYYVDRGWPVLPLHSVDRHLCSCSDVSCKSPGEHPRSTCDVPNASDPEQIRRRWDQSPDANIGIATGVNSGLLVLAVDTGLGETSYQQLEKEFLDAFTGRLLEVRTGAGGRHFYFECRSPTPSLADIRPGIHIKADGSYVIAPPSSHVSGRRYRFVSNSGLVCPPLPTGLHDWILREAQARVKSNQSSSHKSHSSTGVQPAPVPWSDPVDGVVLFAALITALGRHLALPEGALEAIALWVLFTHTFDVAEVSPLLALLSPVPECGKTTALRILKRLVRKAMFASNLTTAVVFRAIDRERPTLLMDEADTYMEQRGDDFRGILNSGHTRDAAVVWRADGDKYEPKAFSTWAPKSLAKIGKLSETLASRSIIILMRRKRPDERVTPYHPDRDGPSLDELARKCARWAKDNLPKLEGADPMTPIPLNNRAADNWRPLFAIADALGGDCPIKARRAALALAGDEVEVTSAEQLLANIPSIRNTQSGNNRISSKDLCQELGKIEGGHIVTPDWLAAMLRPFGIRPHSIRIGQSTPKGYLWKDFEDAFARYLPEHGNSATN